MNLNNTLSPANTSLPRLAMFLLVLGAAGLLLYGSALTELFSAVIHRQGSSHGLFVPFLTLFFLWTKRRVISETALRTDYLGLPLIFVGASVLFFDPATYRLPCLGFLAFMMGSAMLFFGRRLFKEIAFPLFFLLTMIPLPQEMHVALANQVRNISLGGSVKILTLFHIPFHKEGVLIQLPNALLTVDLGCSGIRYLISYFVFGLAYAYLSRDRIWSRVAVVCATIPISLMASVLRLTAIFFLTYIFGPHMSDYWPHVFISWSVFALVLFLAIGLDQFLCSRRERHAQ